MAPIATWRPAIGQLRWGGAVSDASGRLQPAFDLIDRIVAEENVAGAALAVAQDGALIGVHYAGDAAPGNAAGPATLWPLGSISKLYTAATVLALIERGVLALSTPVRQILPTFEGDGRERVTIRHLLTHTAGVIYEPPAMERLLIAQTPLAAIVDEAYRAPLLFPPGEGQSYSDLGFALLGRVAATATGHPFPELVRELVLAPAGLEETRFAPEAGLGDRLAYVSGVMAEGTAGAMYNSPYTRALGHPAFAVFATVEDLARFGLGFAPGGHPFLSAPAVRAMTTDQVGVTTLAEPDDPMSEAMRPWGAGFMIKGATGFPGLASPGSYGHGGATGCLLWIDPAWDAVVAFVSNRHFNADPDGFNQRLERVLNAALASLTRSA
jgi:CubicO group peptidase (beta-lactamase class C family)